MSTGDRQAELARMSGVDFFALAKMERHARTRMRYLALGHVKEGKIKQDVATMFKIHTVTLRNWIVIFLNEGIQGLQEGKRTGRRKKLAKENEEEFRQQIEKLQEKREGGRIRGQDIQVLLKETFHADYKLPSVYDVLARCNVSWISARSKHPKSDPIAQEEFKKNSKKK